MPQYKKCSGEFMFDEKLNSAMKKVDYFIRSESIKIDYETDDKVSLNVGKHNVFILKNGRFSCTCMDGSIYPVLCSHVQTSILYLWVTKGKDWAIQQASV